MASTVRVSIKDVCHKIYMFFTDDDYFCEIVDILVLKYVKIRNVLRKNKLHQFLFEEEIESDIL